MRRNGWFNESHRHSLASKGIKTNLAAVQQPYVDRLPGGLADNKTPADYPPMAVAQGQKVELEHTSDPMLATEVALDHLEEDKEYYGKLEKMESGQYATIGDILRDIDKKAMNAPHKPGAYKNFGDLLRDIRKISFNEKPSKRSMFGKKEKASVEEKMAEELNWFEKEASWPQKLREKKEDEGMA